MLATPHKKILQMSSTQKYTHNKCWSLPKESDISTSQESSDTNNFLLPVNNTTLSKNSYEVTDKNV